MRRLPRSALLLLVLAGGLVALRVGYAGSISVAMRQGVLVAIVGSAALALAILASASDGTLDPSRRRFLFGSVAGAFAWAFGGAWLGRLLRTLTTPDPRPVQEAMAKQVGGEYMELIARAYHPGRSGDLQLVLAPFNSSNYANESRSLVPRDPRTSHASVWMYLERVPLAVYAPGIVKPSISDERVSLADIAPTIAGFLGFDDFVKLGRDGQLLPGIKPSSTSPKVIVTFVIDGGGWNVLHHWDEEPGRPTAWPNLKSLLGKSATFRNAIHGSFPAVTACAHATIGTGSYPRTHGITGHNIRIDASTVRKAYGKPGNAQPTDIKVPTLADLWSDATQNRAFVGEIGYQIWHMGMIGCGGPTRSADQLPVGIYWNEFGAPRQFAPHNPALFRLPAAMPSLDTYLGYRDAYTFPADRAAQFDPIDRQSDCCSPPIVQYQGDVIASTIDSESLGSRDVTDLLFINFKSPDYTGHIYNMEDVMEYHVLSAVDAEIGRLVADLESRFAPGEFVLIVTADHGQCPLPDDVNGTRLDPVQLGQDLEREFRRGMYEVAQYIAPSEIFVDHRILGDTGVSLEQLADFLRDYRYRDNIGAYVPKDAIETDLLNHPEFAAVFATTFLGSLEGVDLSTRYGDTTFTDADPGMPSTTGW